MSQSASAAQLRPQQVTNHMAALANAQDALLTVRTAPRLAPRPRRRRSPAHAPPRHPQNLSDVIDGAIEAGVLYGGIEHTDKVAALRAELLTLVNMQRGAEAYKTALGQLAAAYAPGVEGATDFKQELEALMARARGR